MVNCLWCGKKLKENPYRRKYCDRECKYKAYNMKDNSFELRLSKKIRKFEKHLREIYGSD
ncbi:MAG: hypothetical protein A2Y53_03860 [Chloroflexi bacterium RBG_16_47_49]|nr:MAG: hypothetical protein A2Y53_03860 [Chloroflexi bacterium RBG_16_47_49]